MTRDETIALFLECEAKRAGALAAALAEGKREYEADAIAHEAAKAHWNSWADGLRAERKTMEADARWDSEQNVWYDRAKVDFKFCLFLNKGAVNEEKEAEAKAALERRAAEARSTVKLIAVDSGIPRFDGFIFPGNAWFDSATFTGDAWFGSATFTGDAFFEDATFTGEALFSDVLFPKNVFFEGTRFGPGATYFDLATFERFTSFHYAEFKGEADFSAVAGKRAFNMAGVRFERVPDFIQAHFEEAPRLDNVHVVPPEGLTLLTEVEARNLFARWRELKRLAIQAHDTDRELEFNAQEIRAERAVSHWPIPVKLHEGKRWLESVRSLSGFLYGLFSDYGRSLFRPFIAWAIGIAFFAAFYLSQTEVMRRELELQDVSHVLATAEVGRHALSHSVPCYALDEKPADQNQTRVDGLSEKLRSQTNARAEALHLAFRNAFVVLDGGSDASHRMYGCLYGLELYAGQNPVPIVPSAVSAASAIQKVLSGVLIFLFGLALRNMLKVK